MLEMPIVWCAGHWGKMQRKIGCQRCQSFGCLACQALEIKKRSCEERGSQDTDDLFIWHVSLPKQKRSCKGDGIWIIHSFSMSFGLKQQKRNSKGEFMPMFVWHFGLQVSESNKGATNKRGCQSFSMPISEGKKKLWGQRMPEMPTIHLFGMSSSLKQPKRSSQDRWCQWFVCLFSVSVSASLKAKKEQQTRHANLWGNKKLRGQGMLAMPIVCLFGLSFGL